ncbi:ketopantoate reductase family protein [Croceibacterium aestuarii]|uniref:ketopantoate reductase family protein n=1 Tax=Croceibacterium aestuarii TaxID=3064139 RepID=UPI00272E676C|nr:2-dehydropantoate 2-reductase [Croceibacterium sp. D39]
MRVAVLGAGAMGCLYGAALHRGGADIVLVDVNAEHIAAINARGLELERRSGTERLPIPAVRPEELEGPLDLVLVFTKTFMTDTALAGIAHAIGPATHLLTLQNGLGNEARLAAHVDAARVLIGISSLPSDLVGPGRVRSHGEGGTKLYSAFPSGDPAFAEQVAALLTQGELAASADPAIYEAVWSKAIFNATMNPLCALTLRTPGFLGAHEESLAMIRAAVDEGIAAAHANGVMVDGQAIHDLTRVSITDHADHEASMLQDVKAGRRTEVDAINGAIVEAARGKGVATPLLEIFWRFVKLEEAKLAGE